jgi:penicillin-binding protein 1A
VIDMVRAFAAVQAKGTAVTAYGIRKITSTEGEVLYSHRPDPAQQLVPNFVAAGITDLLQSAVSIGTGRAAQIGRPVAGKTGTTSSNKDGWFLGFSSGITTGVWMGRDDARPVPGLQGGTAPARAFAAYMRIATAKRPPEKFDTDLKLPQWQLEPDDEVMQANPDGYFYADPDGNIIEPGAQNGAPGRMPGGDSALPGGEQGVPVPEGPPAAGDDFLSRATGKQTDPALRPRPKPAPSPKPN